MPNTATITAKIGPGVTNTAQVYTDITNANFDFPEQTLKLKNQDREVIYDIAAATTITILVASGVYTLTVE